MPVSIKRTYRLFYIVSAISFINAVFAVLLDRVDIVIGLTALAVALFALGTSIKTEETKFLWTRVRTQKLDEIRNIVIEIDGKIDEFLKQLKKKK